MGFLDIINNRQSIRKYMDTGIEQGILHDLLDAARKAPSGKNVQPWAFRFVTSKDDKKKLYDAHAFRQKSIYEAPVIAICCTDPTAYKEPVEGWDAPNEYRAKRDLTIATTYMDLRANDLGLGTCWIGWVNEARIKTALDIEEKWRIPHILTIGESDEIPEKKPRKSVDDITLGPKLDVGLDLRKLR
ncbi:MAG: nitroreductase [Candidatus Aenigmarchaeota archaeon]|nr:nitroreductase [Candidatus Aenigmarchaeota archaeon]